MGRSFDLPPAYCLEAVETVNRSRARRHERHLGLLPAVRADHIVHDLGSAIAVGLAPRRPALRTAPRFVLEPTRLVELLLARAPVRGTSFMNTVEMSARTSTAPAKR